VDIALQVNDFVGECFGGPRADQAAAERPGKDSQQQTITMLRIFMKNLLSCVCFSDKVQVREERTYWQSLSGRQSLGPGGSLLTLTASRVRARDWLGHAALKGHRTVTRFALGLVGLTKWPTRFRCSTPRCFQRRRALLAEARGGHAVGGDAEGDEVVLDGSGAAVA